MPTNTDPSERPYDLVVWGATGFVGRLICDYLMERYGAAGDVSWAIAARSRSKLDALRSHLGPNGLQVPVVVANADDRGSLEAMADSARVVISTVGPYAQYGSTLVEVCARGGTDYVDLAGETQWIRRMIDMHQDIAEQSGARIVPACGFDSIPSDLGVFFLQTAALRLAGAPCAQVKMRVKAMKGGASGGTVASMLGVLEEARDDPQTARILADPYALNPAGMREGPRQPDGNTVLYDDDCEAWAAPFVMAAINTRVVQASNARLGYPYGRGFLYDEMMLMGEGLLGQASAWGLALGLGAFSTLAPIGPVRALLDGLVLPQPGQGPSREERERGFYDLRFYGRTPDGRAVTARVTGDRDPGYGSTAKMIVESALCLVRDVPRDRVAGGFWTPASAMGEALIARLEANAGLTFTSTAAEQASAAA